MQELDIKIGDIIKYYDDDLFYKLVDIEYSTSSNYHFHRCSKNGKYVDSDNTKIWTRNELISQIHIRRNYSLYNPTLSKLNIFEYANLIFKLAAYLSVFTLICISSWFQLFLFAVWASYRFSSKIGLKNLYEAAKQIGELVKEHANAKT